MEKTPLVQSLHVDERYTSVSWKTISATAWQNADNLDDKQFQIYLQQHGLTKGSLSALLSGQGWIPRADVPNPDLINAIEEAGGMAFEYRCYGLEPTNEPLNLDGVDAILFTSANSYKMAILPPLTSSILPIAIGEITAAAMRDGGLEPKVIGDGSLEGTLKNLNTYLRSSE